MIPVLTADQVAERYRLSVDRFRKRRSRLEAEGFPRPLPGFGHLLWSERHLEIWEATTQQGDLRAALLHQLGEPPEPAAGGAPDTWRTELAARLADMRKDAA